MNRIDGRAEVSQLLMKRGAVEDPSQGYNYSLDTPGGRLRITPMEGWVACRFDSPEEAELVAGANHNFNPHSGKYNYHLVCSSLAEYVRLFNLHLSYAL